MTMWKTVVMRIRGAKSELEDAGLDTEGMVVSTAKLQEKVKELANGFDIMLNPDTFKSTYDIILGIGKEWQNISDIKQAELLEILAGKRQGNALAAALNNLDDLQSALTTSENAAGSALKEHAKWLDSIEGKQEQLTANFQAFSSAILNSSLLKGSYDAGSGLLGFLTSITKSLGAMPTLASAAAAAMSLFANKGIVSSIPNANNTSGLALSFSGSALKKSIANDVSLMSQYQSGYATATNKIELFNNTLGKASLLAQQQAGALQTGAMTAQTWGNNQLAAAKASGSLGSASKLAAIGVNALKIAMNTLLTMGIAFGIQAIVTGISNLANANKNAIDKAEDLAASWKEQDDKLKSSKKTVDELLPQYEKLGKGVNSLGENIALSNDEYEEYNSISNQLAEIFPGLISRFTEQGTAILTIHDNLALANKEYERYLKNSAMNGIANGNTIFSGFKANFNYGLLDWTSSPTTYQKLLAARQLQSVLDTTPENLQNNVIQGTPSVDYVLKDMGLDGKTVKEIKDTGMLKVQAYLASLDDALNESSSGLKSLLKNYAFISSTGASPEVQSLISQAIDSISWETLSWIPTEADAVQYIQDGLVAILTNPTTSANLENMFTAQKSFDAGTLSATEYRAIYSNLRNSFQGTMIPAGSNLIEQMFGISSLDDMVQAVSDKLVKSDKYKAFQLSLPELKIAYSIESTGEMAWDEFIAKLNEAKEAANQLSESSKTLGDYESIDDFIKSYENRASVIGISQDKLNAAIQTKNTQGLQVYNEDYQKGITLANQKIGVLTEEQTALADRLSLLMRNGLVKEGDDTWTAYTQKLGEVAGLIATENDSIYAFNQAIEGIPLDVMKKNLGSLQGNIETYDTLTTGQSGKAIPYEYYPNMASYKLDESVQAAAIAKEIRTKQNGVYKYSDRFTDVEDEAAKYDAISNAAFLKYQELVQKQLEFPIEVYKDTIGIYDNLQKEAQSTIDTAKTKGEKLDPALLQSIIDNGNSIVGFWGTIMDQASELRDKTEVGSEDYKKYADEYTKAKIAKDAEEIQVQTAKNDLVKIQLDQYDALIKKETDFQKGIDDEITTLGIAGKAIDANLYQQLIASAQKQKELNSEAEAFATIWRDTFPDDSSGVYQDADAYVTKYSDAGTAATDNILKWNKAIEDMDVSNLEYAISQSQGRQGKTNDLIGLAESSGQIVPPSLYNDLISEGKFQESYMTSLMGIYDKVMASFAEDDQAYKDADKAKQEIDNKKTEVQTNIADWTMNLVDLYASLFDNNIQQEESKQAGFQGEIDAAVRNHRTISPLWYEGLISSSQNITGYLQANRQKLVEAQANLDPGSTLFGDLQGRIDAIDAQIREATADQETWNQAIAAIPLDQLDKHLESVQQDQKLAQQSLATAKQYGTVTADNYTNLISLGEDELATLRAKQAYYQNQKNDYISNIGDAAPDQSVLDYYDSFLKQLSIDINTATTSQTELNSALSALPLTALNLGLSQLETRRTTIEKDIATAEAGGGKGTNEQYQELISLGDQMIAIYNAINALLLEQQKGLGETSDEYQDIQKQLDGNNEIIQDIQASQAGWTKSVTTTLTALEKWKAALSGAESGDDYRDITDAIDKMLELMEAGEVGSKKFKAGLELLVPKSLKGDLKGTEAYLKKLKDYFSDGTGGAKKFQKELAEKAPDLASYDESTGIFNLKTKDPQKIAKAMGWSEEAVRAMIGRMNELLVSGKGWTLDPIKLDYDATQAETTLATLNSTELKDKTATLTYNIKYESGTNEFASGTKGAPEGPALVGEAGAEIIYNKKKRFWWLAKNPTIAHLNAGDQVFNNAQTRDMLKGYSGGDKGRAFAVGATNPNWYTDGGSGATSDDTSNYTPPKKKDPSAAFLKALEKLYDWAARALETANKKTQDIIDSAKDAIGYAAQNRSLNSALGSTKSELAKNEAAYALYLAKAEEIAKKTGLSADMVKKIQEGDISLEELDDKTKEKVEAYQEWYDKAQDVKDAIQELRDQETELAKQKLDNITEYYDNRVARLDAQIDRANALIDNKTASGREVTATDYSGILSAAVDKIGMLTDARTALNEEFVSLVASGVIQEDSDAWHEYTSQIEDLDTSIIEANTDVQNFNRTIAQISLTKLQYAMTALQATAQSLQTLQDLVTAQGGAQSALSYLSLIENSKLQVENLKAQNVALIEQQTDLDVLSEKYQEIQSQVNDNNDAILKAKIQQEEWNDAIKDIDIEALQKQKEELQKTNDTYQKQLEIQQAEEALQTAKQRKLRILKDGQFVWESDQKAITDAQNKLDDLRNQAIIDEIDKAIEAIEESKSSNNLYDSLGNLIPQYASGTPRTKEGLAYLHDDEMILNQDQIYSLSNLLNSGYAASFVSEGLMSRFENITKDMSLLDPTNNAPQLIINGGIVMHEVNDAEAFVKELLSDVPLQFQQQLRKN